jgi:hypothetical protein
LEDCNQLCYKDPVLKDQQWSAYIDRSPGSASYSEVFSFHAHVSVLYSNNTLKGKVSASTVLVTFDSSS